MIDLHTTTTWENMEHVMWNTRVHLQMPEKMKLTGVNVQRRQFQQRPTVTLLYITSPVQMSTINTSNRWTRLSSVERAHYYQKYL